MIIQIGTEVDESRILWKKNENDDWKRADIDDLIRAYESIEALSAEAVPQSEQYKKGFEDAKRAFLVEYARESENMRKRNAQLEVMLNAQKAISSADRPTGEWVDTTSGDHYKCSVCGYRAGYWFNEENSCEYSLDISEWLSDYCPNCGAKMGGESDG